MDERRKSENARLESLVRISQYDAESIHDLLDLALSEAIDLTESAIGFIYFYDEKTSHFTLNTWSKGVMDICTVMDPQTVYDLDKTGLWGEVVRQKKPIIVNDYAADNPLKKGLPEGHAPLFRFMTIPVFYQKVIVAVLGLANKKDEYSAADLQQVTLLMSSVWQITERKRFEAELKQSEKKYRTILETMIDAYIEHDLAGDFFFANGAACKMLGCKREDINALNYRQIVSEETAQKMFSVYNRIFRTGKPETLLDFEILPFDGGLRHLELNVKLMVDLSGKPVGYQVMGRDITERKNAENALRRSEEKYRSILENIKEGCFESDLNGNIQFVNNSALTMMGRDRETLYKITYRDFTSPEKAKKIEQTYQAVLRTGAYSQLDDYEIIRGDGAIRIHQLIVGPIKDDSGKIVGTRTVARDVTEQKQAAEALEKSEERIRLLFNNIPVPTFVWKLKGESLVLAEFNTAALELIGDRILDYAGKPADIFFVRNHQIQSDIRECLEKGKAVENQFWYLSDDVLKKRYVVVKYAWAPPDSVLMHMNDITAQKNAEEKLYHASVHDSLTGLFNRFYADAEITRLNVSRARPVSVIVIDLNDLKKINDKDGHAAGDKYIKDAAIVIKKTFRPEDMVARIGGDEFLILLPLLDKENCQKALNRLQKNIQSFNKESQKYVSLSAGFAVAESGDKLSGKVREADADMYRQKTLIKTIQQSVSNE